MPGFLRPEGDDSLVFTLPERPSREAGRASDLPIGPTA